MHPNPGLAIALALLCACSSISRRPDVAARVAAVDVAELRRTVHGLNIIGPRPVSDVDATRRTVDFLARSLRELGYEVEERPVPLTFTTDAYAIVRRAGDEATETTEPTLVPVDVALLASGSEAMRHRSASLRADGWTVEGYSFTARDEPLVVSPPNLFATRRGAVTPSEVIEVGAHYDTVPYCPGANDNSSGVAAVLELARVLADARFERTVRLCFFGAEEVGIKGSEAHVRSLGDADETVVALVNLDPVGFTRSGAGTQEQPPDLNRLLRFFLAFPDEADFVVVAGKSSSAWLGALVEDACAAYVPDLRVYGANRIGHRFPDAHRSDHRHYWEAGIPAVFVTDTGEFRNDTYHGPTDLPTTLDFEFMRQVTGATVAAVMHLARPLDPE